MLYWAITWLLFFCFFIIRNEYLQSDAISGGGLPFRIMPFQLTDAMNRPCDGQWELEFRLQTTPAQIENIMCLLKSKVDENAVTISKVKSEIITKDKSKWVRETTQSGQTSYYEKIRMHSVECNYKCQISTERPIEPFDEPADITRFKYRVSWLAESEGWRWDLTIVDNVSADLFDLDLFDPQLMQYKVELEVEFVGDLLNMPEKWDSINKEISSLLTQGASHKSNNTI